MKPIKLTSRALDVLAEVICGGTIRGMDQALTPYRKWTEIEAFFTEDIGLADPPTPPMSRTQFARACLARVNGTPTMHEVLSACGRPVDFHGTDFSAARLAEVLNGVLEHEGLRLVEGTKGFVVVGRIESQVDGSALSSSYVAALVEKCESRLGMGDFEGATTVARTLLEAVLGKLEEKLVGTRTDHKGELPKQFKAVAKALNMDDQRPDLDARFKDLVRGLVVVANAIAPLRSGLGDAHPRKRAPAEHHARLIVNSAKTVATFLVDSYKYQHERSTKGRAHAETLR